MEPSRELELTYDQLYEAVASASQKLRSSSRKLAFLVCANNVSSVVGYLASLQAGHVVFLIDGRLEPALFANLLEAYQPEIVLGNPPIQPTNLKLQVESQGLLPPLWEYPGSVGAPIHEDLALLLSTSGSTGSPKLVKLTRRAVASNANAIVTGLDISQDDRAMTCLPLHYSYGLSILNSHLAAGATVVLTDESMMSQPFWEQFLRSRSTALAGVPYSYAIYERLDLTSMDLPTLRTMTQAGGKLSLELTKKYHQFMTSKGGRYFTMYGQTEATARISILPTDREDEKLGSVGVAVSGGYLTVGDEFGDEGGQAVGEIFYKGPSVMMGYAHSRRDLACGDVLDGQLETGDVGYLDEDRFLYVTGRSKRIAKVFGLRLNLDEIESLSSRFGRTATIASGDRIHIYVEGADPADAPSHARRLARLLKINYRAFDVHCVSHLPTTSAGKIDYPALGRDS